MNFNPDHPKWQCGCCQISTALTALACAEIVASLAALLFCAISLRLHLSSSNNEEEGTTQVLFYLSAMGVMALMLLGSALLLVGVRMRNKNLLYPTLLARVLFLVFVAAFGAGAIMQHGNGSTAPKLTPYGARKITTPTNSVEPSITPRLAFFVILMVVVSAATLYTIYWVVRCIRFVESMRKLSERRDSLIAATMIDPQLLASARRTSRISG